MENLKAVSFELRKLVLDMVKNSKAGHIGGDFSVMDILISLYMKQMNITPDNMDDPDRDMFVMSKGHSVEAYYAVLSQKGFFSKDRLLNEYYAFGSEFIGHPNNKLPGIEMNTGSLGHGLPVSVGMALASKMDGRRNRIYTVMGDGELAEGSVWEGFMAASHYKLDNLCVIIDRNKLQISGNTEDIMDQECLEDRLRSFNWHVLQVDGNDIDKVAIALDEAKAFKGTPTCIIANTVKGFGGGEIMENKAGWHHRVPTDEEYKAISAELDRRREAALNECDSQ